MPPVALKLIEDANVVIRFAFVLLRVAHTARLWLWTPLALVARHGPGHAHISSPSLAGSEQKARKSKWEGLRREEEAHKTNIRQI